MGKERERECGVLGRGVGGVCCEGAEGEGVGGVEGRVGVEAGGGRGGESGRGERG